MTRWPWAMLATLTLIFGCTSTGSSGADDRVLPVKTLYSNAQCGGLDRPTVLWIARVEEWRSQYGQITSLRMDAPPPPVIDFTRDGVLLVAIGSRPSSGYGLSLAGASATVREGVLTVRVDWREPLPGYRQAQVMSNPCVLAKLPNAPFTRIQILDQAGRVRLEGIR